MSSSRIKLATLALLRCSWKCDHNHFESLFPTFFSKKINTLLFLCILSSPIHPVQCLTVILGVEEEPCFCRGHRELSFMAPSPPPIRHPLAGPPVVRGDEGLPLGVLGRPEATPRPLILLADQPSYVLIRSLLNVP